MLKSNAVPIVLNIGDEEDFRGIVDLVKNRAIVWHDDNFGSTFDVIDIPDDLKDEAKNLEDSLNGYLNVYKNHMMTAIRALDYFNNISSGKNCNEQGCKIND